MTQFERLFTSREKLVKTVLDLKNKIENDTIYHKPSTGIPISDMSQEVQARFDYVEKDGKLYPVSHPDITTQASLLPQRFGNYDMYERLIPTSDLVLDGNDLVYPAVYEEKGMIVTSCFLISNNLTMAGIATITRDYFTDGDKILFSCCNSDYNVSYFDYILVQYYISTNPAYYYDDEQSQPEDVDEIGNVTKNSSSLSISIDDGALPEGTYSMVYEDSTGRPLEGVDEITNFTIS